MIISLFLTLLAISAFLIIIGGWLRESGYSLLGFAFLIILSSTIILSGNLEYQTGKTVLTNYTYNSTSISSTFQNETLVYNKWRGTYSVGSNIWFGIWLMFVGLIGFILNMVEVGSVIQGRK